MGRVQSFVGRLRFKLQMMCPRERPDSPEHPAESPAPWQEVHSPTPCFFESPNSCKSLSELVGSVKGKMDGPVFRRFSFRFSFFYSVFYDYGHESSKIHAE